MAKKPPARKHRRIRQRKARRGPQGAPAGSLTVDPSLPPSAMRVMAFDESELVEHGIDDPEQLRPLMARFPVVWLDVDGVGQADIVHAIGQIFDLHPLALEDTVHVHQRPKVEEYPNHWFFVARMVHEHEAVLTLEQVSFFLGRGFVITFQEERTGDCFDPVRERLRSGRSRIRRGAPDFLAYALLDALIDGYFPCIEHLGERIEELEEGILASSDSALVHEVHAVKRDLITLRRSIWPLRDAVALLTREEDDPLISPETRLYLRDCQDHCVQIVDLLETYRDQAASLMDLHLTAVSNGMNEVMKVLTIIATIFIPLSFIAGLYGMNFDPKASPLNMPELGWYLGYPFALALMAATAGAMLAFFYRRGWL